MLQQKMKIHSQYIKDLSFENPNSPFVFSNKAPDINVMVNISSIRLRETENQDETKSLHEITLHIEIKAVIEDKQSFICDIKYCGVFVIENSQIYDEENLRKILFVGAPNFLFPFVREIIARITSSGGFPPLMLDPINFETMYEQQKSKDSHSNLN
ncbi:protein-export chaperone SecB [Wolbachia endosymbiont of Pentidionis agamae]|uniref:protein-export chaperone SecB n=1 Tax=Wolbachia endosymbiont of Pentidionis agamae TaxID=3110435 RepID=UPI002FD522F7